MVISVTKTKILIRKKNKKRDSLLIFLLLEGDEAFLNSFHRIEWFAVRWRDFLKLSRDLLHLGRSHRLQVILLTARNTEILWNYRLIYNIYFPDLPFDQKNNFIKPSFYKIFWILSVFNIFNIYLHDKLLESFEGVFVWLASHVFLVFRWYCQSLIQTTYTYIYNKVSYQKQKSFSFTLSKK